MIHTVLLMIAQLKGECTCGKYKPNVIVGSPWSSQIFSILCSFRSTRSLYKPRDAWLHLLFLQKSEEFTSTEQLLFQHPCLNLFLHIRPSNEQAICRIPFYVFSKLFVEVLVFEQVTLGKLGEFEEHC